MKLCLLFVLVGLTHSAKVSQCLDDYGDYMDTPPGPETCQKTSGGPACSGQGNCVCGVCKCNTDSRGIIYGRFCECDTWSCPKSSKGILCNNHGKCECSRCWCYPGWSGQACDCLVENTMCMSLHSKKVCSGNGICECGRCVCDHEYTGRYCEHSPFASGFVTDKQGTQTDISGADVGWAGDVLQQLSPRVSEMCTKLLNSRVEPLVQGALAALNLGSKAFKFTRINLGHVQPKITNIRTHGAVSDMHRIVIDFDMIYDGNADIQVAILGTASGLKNVKIAGRARIVLSPTMSELPLVGGIQFFFLTKPEIDFDFDGLAKVADLPVIKKKIKEDLLKDLNEQAVFPNRITIPLSWTANPQMIWQPQISGILGVKLKSMKGLPRRGGMRKFVGQDRPDVYGMVSVGSKEWNTNVVKNSQEATWNEWYEFPLEVVDGHLVEINMYDDDTGSNDEFLGYAALDVHSAMQTPHFLSTQKNIGSTNVLQSNQPLISRSTTAKLEMVPGRKTKYANISGEVDLEMAWMPLVNVPEPVPAGFLPSPRAIIKVANYTSKTETAKKTQQATFNHGEVYMLQSNWKTQTLVIKVEESDSGKAFGSISIPLTSLQGKDLVQELMPLNPAQPSITITISASIRFPYAK